MILVWVAGFVAVEVVLAVVVGTWIRRGMGQGHPSPGGLREDWYVTEFMDRHTC